MSASELKWLDAICDRFEDCLRKNQTPRIEDYITGVSGRRRADLLYQLILLELDYRTQKGAPPHLEDFLRRFPNDGDVIRAAFGEAQPGSGSVRQIESTTSQLKVRCPHCWSRMRVATSSDLEAITCPSCGGKTCMHSGAQPPLKTIGQFELLEKLGAGGFGHVWKAKDKKLDRVVAIKIPYPWNASALQTHNLLHEARTAAQLRHRGIVSVHEVGSDGQTSYIVSEFIPGCDLSAWMMRNLPTIEESVVLCCKIADALHHAHERGVIHRDLKPQNVLIDDEGEPYITDFGLAKREQAELTFTIDGELLGTPGYMSPEQAAGKSHLVDRRTDIYSLGVILFRMITGELPFRGTVNRIIAQVQQDDAPSPRRFNHRVPRDLETICLKCLSKEPAGRYRTACELREDLERFQNNAPIKARRISLAAKAWRTCNRHRTVSLLSLTLLLTLMLSTAFSTYFAVQARLSEARKTEVMAQSLITTIRALRQARPEGYRTKVWQLVRTVRDSGAANVNMNELRREATGAMGDFVGFDPIDYRDFSATVTTIAFRPKGEHFLVGLDNGEIRIYHRRTGDLLTSCALPEESVLAFAFQPMDESFFSISTSKSAVKAVRWQTDDSGESWVSEVLWKIDGPVRAAAIANEKQHVLLQYDSQIAVRHLLTSRQIGLLQEPGTKPMSAAISPRGEYVTAAYFTPDYQTGLLVWNTSTGRRRHRIPVNLGFSGPQTLRFSVDGRFLVAGCDQALALYDAPAFTPRWSRRIDSASAVAIDPTEQFVAVQDIRGVISILSVSTEKQIANLSQPKMHPSAGFMTFSPDGAFLAAASRDAVRTWDLTAARERKQFAGHRKATPTLCFTPDGESLISGSKDQSVVNWDPRTGAKKGVMHQLDGPVQCVVISDDSSRLAVAHWNHARQDTITVWDARSGRLLYSLPNDLADVNRIAFAKGGEYLVAAGDKKIAIWRLLAAGGKSQPELVFSAGKGRCLFVTVSPNGQTIAWVEEIRLIHVFHLAEMKRTRLKAPPMLQGWHGIGFLPDDKTIIYINQDRRACIWDIQQDRLVGFIGDKDTFGAPHLAISPDGELLAALRGPDVVSIWDIPKRREVMRFRPERAAIWALSWNSDGGQLGLGLADGGISLWDLKAVEAALDELGIGRSTRRPTQ